MNELMYAYGLFVCVCMLCNHMKFIYSYMKNEGLVYISNGWMDGWMEMNLARQKKMVITLHTHTHTRI